MFKMTAKTAAQLCAWLACSLPLAAVLLPAAARAQQEPPYFVTYSTVLEEPGNLEIENQDIAASPKNANSFLAPTVEFEYGVKAWWTTEAYLQGQTTTNDSTVFTGFRFENRFRPLPREYWINPVIYLEYEDVNDADKSFLEITGNTSITTKQLSNGALRKEVERSIEGKVILSSNAKGWNISENIIAEKAVNEAEAWEFGYALGAARPLALKGSSRECAFCLQNFAAGAELFGGLGTRYSFGLKQTEQYAGPTLLFNTPHGVTLKFSPEFGLNDNSAGVLWRLGASYEIQQLRDWFRRAR
jgi:hypothetical protein